MTRIRVDFNALRNGDTLVVAIRRATGGVIEPGSTVAVFDPDECDMEFSATAVSVDLESGKACLRVLWSVPAVETTLQGSYGVTPQRMRPGAVAVLRDAIGQKWLPSSTEAASRSNSVMAAR